MTTTRLIPVAALLFAGLLASVSFAAPVGYQLEADKSQVGFVYQLSGVPTVGQMPVRAARIAIDFQNLAASSVDVTLDVGKAKAGLIFATEALKARSVLDAGRHPTIRFVSTRVRPNGPGINTGARIDGQLTIRGVSRPVTLNAALFRQKGTAAGDRSRLSFRLTGAVNRSDFGASGYADLVKDRVELDIIARIRR